MGNRFKTWADSGDDNVRPIPPVRRTERAPEPAPPAQSPTFVQPRLTLTTPTPKPVFIQQVPYGTSHRPVQVIASVSGQCSIVKGNQDNYARLLEQLPDLAQQANIDLSNGVDAMRDFVSIPEGAVMNKWTPGARYYNGRTDSNAPHINQHLARGGDSVESIRSSSASVIARIDE